MLKGQVFANQLFENQIFALFINTFVNGANGVSDNYKNGMEITYSGSNLTIDSGAVLIQGRFLEEDTSTTISAGADNMFCKLVVEIDLDKSNTSVEFNQGYYKILKSASNYPTLTQTNIVKNNSGIYQYELARFKTTSTGITDFQDMRTFIDFTSIYAEIEEYIQELENQSNLVFKTGSTMTGKLIAEGGIEGNVEGNITGNVTGNVSGNSGTASKLKTARKIALTGAVSGNANFDGSGNVTISTTNPNIAVLSVQMGTGEQYTFSYPTGFNKDNCVVLSCMVNSEDTTNKIPVTGYTFDSNAISLGVTPFEVALRPDGIFVRTRTTHIEISETGALLAVGSSAYLKYKVVLMKVS